MSWMERLYQTYTQASKLDLPLDERIPPIYHTIQNAHINIVLNEKSEFVQAKVLKSFPIILPATENSESRTNGEAPHAFADKIQYVAKDYEAWGGTKTSYFNSYFQQLSKWCETNALDKIKIVHAYIEQGMVLTDLVEKAKIFQPQSHNTILTAWPKDQSDPLDIFNSLPQKSGVIEPGDALICWSVHIPGNLEPDTWEDSEIWQNWIDYLVKQEKTKNLCLIKGDVATTTKTHPAKLRHSGDKAKLISSNDSKGMTFRGRFSESNEAATISSDVTQKVHTILRWLIARQGIKNDSQCTVAWAISCKPIINPFKEIEWNLDEDENQNNIDENIEKEGLNHSEDIGHRISQKIRKKLHSYQAKLEETEQLSLIMLDSATPGRMSINYYREFLSKEYFDNINIWYKQFAWYQRITKEIAQNSQNKKKKKWTIWSIIPPSPSAIAEAAYGRILNGKLKKQIYAQLLSCIAEGTQLPEGLMRNAVQHASNPLGHDYWQWERNLGVACALFRGFYARSPQKRSYEVALEENNVSRDYLYGRLLAVAERLESFALYIAGEKRRTTAERYMYQFSQKPFSTWRNIALALDPYKNRLLSNNRKGFLINREKEITDIHNAFAYNDYCCDNPLSGEFLLGYHCQKIMYRNSKAANSDEHSESDEEKL